MFTIKFTKQQSQTEHEISLDNQREAALQAYLDRIAELLLEKKLFPPEANREALLVVRVRTLTVLHQLNAYRRGTVFRFLAEAGLIKKNILNLKDADFSEIDISDVSLMDAEIAEWSHAARNHPLPD